MTGIEEVRRDLARVQIRETMRRVNEFYRKYPVGPCPECGKLSRLSGGATPGLCLECMMR